MSNNTDWWNNTLQVNYPYPNATEYYPTIADGWDSTFDNEDWYYTPYMTFGDVTSLLYVNDTTIYDPFGIFGDACWDGGIQNCTSVCSNATLLFSNITSGKDGIQMNTSVPYNVLTCMFYPVISKLLGEKHENDTSWQQLHQMADQYNIVPNASSELIQTIVDTQVNCYTSYCSYLDSEFCVNYDFNTGGYQAVEAPGVMPVRTRPSG